MQAFLNGRFVPEEHAVVPITDRGFLYGDGLFETIAVRNGIPLWWSRHLTRLQRGAELLRLTLPWPIDELHQAALELIRTNAMPEGTLRLAVSRGSGTRGYSIQGASSPTVAMSLHALLPPPASIRLATATLRVHAHDPLSAIKSANKLMQILARAEAEEGGADEALLLNTEGEVAEAASSNLFWIAQGTVETAPISAGALPGVTRAVVLELCRAHQVPTRERLIARAELFAMDGVFATNSSQGIVPVSAIDAQQLKRSPLVEQLQRWLAEADSTC